MGPVGTLAMDTAQAGINTGLGMLLQKHNDKRQLKQQGLLNEQQLAINKRQMAYGKGLDLQMWKDTNYPAQVEQLKLAGMNPALLYGGGGGGGTTTGGSAGGVSAGSAPGGGGEIIGLQMMQAQKNLIEAQTEKTKAETTKTEGVDTELTGNQARIAGIEGQMKHDTYEETFNKIRSEAEKIASEARMAAQGADVGEATVQTKIATAQAELMGIGIANELKRTQTELTEEQIEATIQSVAQKWEDLAIQGGRLDLDRFTRDIADSTKLTVETIGKVVSAVAGGKFTKYKDLRN